MEDEYEEQEEINSDNLSDRFCDTCGKRLLAEEYQKFEAQCEECTWTDTSGLIDYED